MPKMRAVQIVKPHELRVTKLDVPTPGPGEVLIRVMASGVCGTDIHILEGTFVGEYPVVPGHEFSGFVEAVGEGVTRFKVGDRVAVEPNIPCDNCRSCLNNMQNFCEHWKALGVTLPGGMAEYTVAPEKAVFNIGDLEFDEGAFVEPLSCVLHGLQKTGIRLGDNVLIIGAGPIGLLHLQVVRALGAGLITVAEKDPERLDMAMQFDADAVFATLEELSPDTFDVVIDATGVLPVMSRAVEFVKKGGRILLFGVPPHDRLELDAFTLFIKGLTVHTSFTSVRNSLQAITMMQSGGIDTQYIVSHHFPLESFADAVKLIRSRREYVGKIMILPNG